MIRVVVRNNVTRQSFNVTDDTTVGAFMDEHADIMNTGKTPMLNGVTIDQEIESQTFAQRANGCDTVYLSFTKNSEGN